MGKWQIWKIQGGMGAGGKGGGGQKTEKYLCMWEKILTFYFQFLS